MSTVALLTQYEHKYKDGDRKTAREMAEAATIVRNQIVRSAK